MLSYYKVFEKSEKCRSSKASIRIPTASTAFNYYDTNQFSFEGLSVKVCVYLVIFVSVFKCIYQ